MIKEELLIEYGAVTKHLSRGQMLFQEGDEAIFFYQIRKGSIKMNNYNDEGKEMIQGIFKKGDSFGEPAIFGAFPFPANAIAIEDSSLICLEKFKFLEFLKKNVDISIELLAVLSKRLRFKAMISKEIKGYQAEHQIMTLLQYLKKNAGVEEEYLVDITRQTIANLTGLRVETVIRAMQNLRQKGMLSARNRKLYL